MNRFATQAEAAEFLQATLQERSTTPIDTNFPAVLLDAIDRPRVMKSSGQSPNYWPIIKDCRRLLQVSMASSDAAQK